MTQTDYIGACIQLCETRWYQHRTFLRQGTHPNAALQKDWATYGEAAFTFEVVESLQQILETREAYWITRTLEEGACYNSRMPGQLPHPALLPAEPPPGGDELLTLGQAAELLGVTRVTLDHWAKNGRLNTLTVLPYGRRKGVWRYVRRSDIEKLVLDEEAGRRLRRKRGKKGD